MGNITTTLKKFFSNKNTVTILGVIVGVIVLWGFYNYRLNHAITPIKVPIAKERIASRTEITQNDIEYVEINSALLKKSNIVTDVNSLVNHYVNIGTSIPKGGLFYTEQVVEKKLLPDSITDDIPKGHTLYQLKVDNNSTFANSILPGNHIDLYLKAKDENTGRLLFGCFIKSIKVLAVRDSSGQDVFEETGGKRTPNWLLFAVPNEMYQLLKTVDYENSLTLLPVPRNRKYTEEAGATEIDSEELLHIVQNYFRPVDDSYSNGEADNNGDN